MDKTIVWIIFIVR